jgi:hypothetical protein
MLRSSGQTKRSMKQSTAKHAQHDTKSGSQVGRGWSVRRPRQPSRTEQHRNLIEWARLPSLPNLVRFWC